MTDGNQTKTPGLLPFTKVLKFHVCARKLLPLPCLGRPTPRMSLSAICGVTHARCH